MRIASTLKFIYLCEQKLVIVRVHSVDVDTSRARLTLVLCVSVFFVFCVSFVSGELSFLLLLLFFFYLGRVIFNVSFVKLVLRFL